MELIYFLNLQASISKLSSTLASTQYISLFLTQFYAY